LVARIRSWKSFKMGGGGSKDGGPKKSTRPVQNFRLLLLGSGGSGKSTVFKQMRIQKGVGIPDDQRKFLTKSMQLKMVALARSVIRCGNIVDNEHYEKNADQAAAIKEALVGGGATEDQITTLDGMADAKAKEALDGDGAADLLATTAAVWKAIAETQEAMVKTRSSKITFLPWLGSGSVFVRLISSPRTRIFFSTVHRLLAWKKSQPKSRKTLRSLSSMLAVNDQRGRTG